MSDTGDDNTEDQAEQDAPETTEPSSPEPEEEASDEEPEPEKDTSDDDPKPEEDTSDDEPKPEEGTESDSDGDQADGDEPKGEGKKTIEATVDEVKEVTKVVAEKLRILVVEDSLPLRKMLVKLLTSNNFLVDEATDGQVALNTLLNPESPKFNLVVCDLMMPGMDGITCIQKLHEKVGKEHPPIVICSSRSDLETIKVVQRLGAVGYILKPFKTATVLAKVHESLGLELPEK